MQIISDIFTSTGKSTQTHWGQTIDFSIAFGVIEVTSQSDSARDIGVRFVSELSEMLEKQTSIGRLKQQIQSILPKEVTSLILLVPHGNSVNLLLLGIGSIYMRRKATFALLTNAPGVLTGEVTREDSLLLLNASAGIRCGENVAKILSPHLSPKEVAEALVIEFSEEDKRSSSAAAGLIFAVSDVVSDGQRPMPPLPSKPLRTYRLHRIDIHKEMIRIKMFVKNRPYVLLSVAF
jgi:hypothetical protein